MARNKGSFGESSQSCTSSTGNRRYCLVQSTLDFLLLFFDFIFKFFWVVVGMGCSTSALWLLDGVALPSTGDGSTLSGYFDSSVFVWVGCSTWHSWRLKMFQVSK